MARKRILASVLAVLLLLSCCFTVSAATYDSINFFDIDLRRSVTNGTSTSTVSYDYTVSDYHGNKNFYAISPNDKKYWASGGVKIFQSYKIDDFVAGHDYEMRFSAGVNFNATYTAYVLFDGERIYETTFSGDGAKAISFNFTAPDVVSPYTSIIFVMEIGNNYGYGSGDSELAYWLLGKTVEYTDRTEEPGWLGKILQRFTDLGDRISGFFTNLGNTIGGFFTDLKDSLVQKFVDLGNSIGEFFDMLRDYILYFEHPVELDSNGVPIGADGKPVYTNPFASKLDEFKTTVNGWLDTINGFINSIDSSRVAVAGYLSNGSTLINGVLTAVPILSVVLTFAIVFLVVRKVVGR